ncbi:sulfocyanin-like copper-binding protein [Sulfuracidifex tepidarius]|uniref:Sulfocyanin-like C-terminal domain-containing protein n=1 Tax=Sulfuracidifex tepidarius TaxID=1294262 RepID=A0A510DX62_9CREN|nr:sulfocyanin-like copper-binding protein [Sulfuracidifex tepidarius]BBG24784.1 hypothetical protein IC006_2118 [Sulfuracidifex tepidarius]BBG27570.1 hypothetical protein IC007_2124 [Sulfuracidifex tepidarius]
MAKVSTLEVTVIVIAIVLVAVAGYYIAVRSTPINLGVSSSTSTAPAITTSLAPTTSTSVSTSTTSPSTSSSTTSLPSGATMLPYDSSNKTVFLDIVSLSSATPFNFNGTSNGQLHVYIPAGWTVLVTYTNQEGLSHNFLIVSNNTATPGDDVGQDGTIKLYVGTTPSTYLDNGINGGASATGSVSLPAGIYWFCCGIEGHAAAGMWGVIVSSSSVTTPYYTG